MKSILYVGAALMVGAGIYGFVDYNKTNKSKEFQSLYREVQPKTEVKTVNVPEEVKSVELVNKKVSVKEEPAKTTTAVKVKKAAPVKKKNFKKFSARKFSRAPLREDIILDPVPAESKL